jgi:hypothetical protein
MMRLANLVAIVALGAVAALVLAPSRADDKKPPTIKEIMTKAHKGANSLLSELGKDLKEDSVDWGHVQEHAKELLDLGKGLAKNEPPRGDKASWEKLTKLYEETATTLTKAAEKKDQKAAQAAQKKLAGMCKNCHSAHK